MDRGRIKRIVQESGHTYRTLADEIGVSPQAISEIVSGRTRGNTARYALAVALGVSVEDLWPGTTDRREEVPTAGPTDAAPRFFSGGGEGVHSVRRIAAVQATGMLGEGRSAAMDRLARIARATSQAAQAILLLADGRRLHIIGGDGLPARMARSTCPLTSGPIQHVVATGEPLAVGNLPADERFSADTLLEKLAATSMAAAPLVDADDHVLGALVVADTRSRQWATGCIAALQDVASAAAGAIAAQGLGQTVRELRERLAEVEERFENLTAHSEQVFWISQPYSGRAVYVSPAFERVFGVDGRRVTEEGAFLDLIHPDDRDRVAASLPRQVMGPYQHDYRVVHPEGEVRWVRSRAMPVPNAAGETYRVMGIARDVTEERELESFLKAALERYYQSPPREEEIFWQGDRETIEFRASGRTEQRFGPLPERAEGWAWWEERVHPEDRDRTIGSIWEAIRSQSGLWGEEYRFRTTAGTFRRIRDVGYVFRAGSPRLIGIMEDLGPADS